MSKVLSTFKSAPWLTAERAALWSACFAVAWVIFLICDTVLHTSHGVINAAGEYAGRDFINYWSGARLAVRGQAARAYDLDFFYAFEKTFAGPDAGWKMYSYPPVAMLLSLPLAVLPFMAGFVIWTVLGAGLCIWLQARETGWRWAWRAQLGAPSMFLNLVYGQNGCFTAALLAGGLMQVERRPVLAGFLLGLLCYKPQLGLLLPFALMAGGHWRTFFSAAVTATLLVLASRLALGPEVWKGFLAQAAYQRSMMEDSCPGWHRMPTIFCSLRRVGGSTGFSYVAQILSALLAGGIVVFLWRKKCSLYVRAAGLVLASFLATPYAWDYDMVIMTFAVIWLVRDAAPNNFLPWEKIMWLAVIVLPLPMMVLAQYLRLPIGPLVLWPALLLVLRRGLAQQKSASLMAGG